MRNQDAKLLPLHHRTLGPARPMGGSGSASAPGRRRTGNATLPRERPELRPHGLAVGGICCRRWGQQCISFSCQEFVEANIGNFQIETNI